MTDDLNSPELPEKTDRKLAEYVRGKLNLAVSLACRCEQERRSRHWESAEEYEREWRGVMAEVKRLLPLVRKQVSMLCSRRIITFGPRQCRLKYLFEFAQGLGAHEPLLGDPGLAAGRDVQHPERHFQNPRCLEVFQAAVRHRLAAFHESGMNTYRSPMPRMPGVADFAEIPNMGVVSLSCITPRGTIRAKETSCSSPPRQSRDLADASLVENASAACFNTTAEPLEYFGHTGMESSRRYFQEFGALRCDPVPP